MKSLKELFRIGNGPSSSHTMGPKKAAEIFLSRHAEAASFTVTLYGSLAATGKGHFTDTAILSVLEPHAKTEIVWQPKVVLPRHPNGMNFKAFDSAANELDSWTVFSVGGGALADEDGKPVGMEEGQGVEIYEMNTMTELLSWCEKGGRSYWEYVRESEGSDIWDYLEEVWLTMKSAVQKGLQEEGSLPGPLNLPRKAVSYFVRASGYTQTLKSRGLVFSYALAVSEENASGGKIVTAPTCGSSGVVPAVLYHLQTTRDFSTARILRALATAGLIGNIVKHNASISGAE
ncbi:MAG TPA: serine dehydratase beta chain, partial [Candidatus Ozemobacteraceae bacterium]|nr:serine dehydratase beta chain [Candidatus Ozemobacteraceae bacterium]